MSNFVARNVATHSLDMRSVIEMVRCCFDNCSNHIGRWGNNAQPLMDGRCCNECNAQKVIPARLMNIPPYRTTRTERGD